MFAKALRATGIFLFCCLGMIAKPCHPEGSIQMVENAGAIDWEQLLISCTGVGTSDTLVPAAYQRAFVVESARADAIEKLMETLKGIAITSQITVNHIMKDNGTLQGQARELVKKFREIGIHYMTDGSVEMDAELPLYGELLELLLPSSGGGKRIPDGLLCPLCGQPWPASKEVPRELKLIRPEGDLPKPFSGLLVDARGLGLKSALAPKIVNQRGKTVYGVEFAKRSQSLKEGIVGYVRDPNPTQNRERVGSNPLVIKGLRVQGPNRTDVVIDNANAATLHSMPEHLRFMEQCRVIIVLD
ncbi:MAG: hypothetical protein AMJ92_00710 [candidate division Zixibacteria bacterium SM23_81]|nr:MAG: hypothetical protein AMJ92_00710 [candidate division Zixibacteria bacterium SM23_81]